MQFVLKRPCGRQLSRGPWRARLGFSLPGPFRGSPGDRIIVIQFHSSQFHPPFPPSLPSLLPLSYYPLLHLLPRVPISIILTSSISSPRYSSPSLPSSPSFAHTACYYTLRSKVDNSNDNTITMITKMSINYWKRRHQILIVRWLI